MSLFVVRVFLRVVGVIDWVYLVCSVSSLDSFQVLYKNFCVFGRVFLECFMVFWDVVRVFSLCSGSKLGLSMVFCVVVRVFCVRVSVSNVFCVFSRVFPG